jgi:hypothetical protein
MSVSMKLIKLKAITSRQPTQADAHSLLPFFVILFCLREAATCL